MKNFVRRNAQNIIESTVQVFPNNPKIQELLDVGMVEAPMDAECLDTFENGIVVKYKPKISDHVAETLAMISEIQAAPASVTNRALIQMLKNSIRGEKQL